MSKIKYICIAGIVLVLCILLLYIVVRRNNNSFDNYSKDKPVVDFGKFYELEINEDYGIMTYTDNTKVNSLISDICNSNEYLSVEVLEDWDDVALKVHTYTILFDHSALYYISVDSESAYANPGDYEYWIEMNKE